MRVLFLQQQPCIRALKYAVGLHGAVPGIRLAFAYRGRTLTQWYGSGDELFERWWRLEGSTPSHVQRVIGEFKPDLVHSHNLPDVLTVAAQAACAQRIPVIHDVHDLQSLRRTPYEDGFPEPRDPLELELGAVEGSSALVTISDELLAEITARYMPPPRTLTFANYALGRDLPALPPAERVRDGSASLVYQGTLSTNGGHYDQRELFTDILRTGATLDVYPNRDIPEYRQLARRNGALRIHERLEPAQLLRSLVGYDFGWAGFNATLNGAHLDTALPNKVFEYLGCGLPVVTLGHRAIRRLLEQEGVGVALDSAQDLRAALSALDSAELRRRVAASPKRFTVEANISRAAELYETLVG